MRRCALAILILLACTPRTRAQTQANGQAETLSIERVRLPRAPEVAAGNRILTVVRVNLSRYRLNVLSSVRDGAPRPLDAWIRDRALVGGVNAGMFLADRRPVATLVDRGTVLSDRNPRAFDGIVGWDPVHGGNAIGVGGRGCADGLDAMRRRFGSVVQGFRMMIDCQGRPIAWPSSRRYSAVAFGADDRGRAVFVHSRTPYRMRELNRMIADLHLGIRGLVYMEGGPEASLVVRDGARSVTEIGSWEDGFHPSDDNRELWEIPSVIGFARR
jgi:hypothetical protein